MIIFCSVIECELEITTVDGVEDGNTLKEEGRVAYYNSGGTVLEHDKDEDDYDGNEEETKSKR